MTQYPGPKENWVVHDFKGPDPIPREASLLGQPLQRGWLGCTRGRERERALHENGEFLKRPQSM